ncbi:ATP-binding cassette domain-containing protein [Streptomyces sp. NPDC091292]|uniref:ABC transporter ATP-binding protein n=1 Tax=Streptomyces sp. NPDC091292 TaxID=3365991 RepID=UPI0037F6D1F8
MTTARTDGTARPSTAASGIRLLGVGRRYGLAGPWILRGVDLAVPAGHLVRIEGANGTGKSTLLRLLAGIDAPTEGRVRGRPRTAYVPERFPPRLPFTAVAYLTHLGRVHGLSRRAAVRAAREWMERLGAAGHLGTPLAELSKGSSQKVAVAQALLAAPDLLVLDEAWTGLDTRARAELDRAVGERTAAGGAVVFVDHDPLRLAGAADATYAVDGGGLVEGPGTGSPVVVIEAQAEAGAEVSLPVGATVVRTSREGVIRVTVPAAYSDEVLRTLLTARPAWHVISVRSPGRRGPVGPAREAGGAERSQAASEVASQVASEAAPVTAPEADQ